MHIAILSRNKNLHSIRRLLLEAKKARVKCDIIDPLECEIVIDGLQSKITVAGKELPRYDAILPRIGASITDYGLAVVKQFEISRHTHGQRLLGDRGVLATKKCAAFKF